MPQTTTIRNEVYKMGNTNPNTTGMIRYQKKNSTEKKSIVLSILKEMLATETPITKAEICKRSGVSRTFLYSNPELLDPINKAIMYTQIAPKPAQKQPSDKTKDILIESLKRRNAQLTQRNKELQREREILLGKLADK